MKHEGSRLKKPIINYRLLNQGLWNKFSLEVFLRTVSKSIENSMEKMYADVLGVELTFSCYLALL